MRSSEELKERQKKKYSRKGEEDKKYQPAQRTKAHSPEFHPGTQTSHASTGVRSKDETYLHDDIHEKRQEIPDKRKKQGKNMNGKPWDGRKDANFPRTCCLQGYARNGLEVWRWRSASALWCLEDMVSGVMVPGV